jgi:mannose-1-phosphate guanylyltransferase
MRKAAVILAGGSGVRLWPLSRPDRPKQLMRLAGQRSLLLQAVDRLMPLFAPQDIYVVALEEHLPAIRRELPDLPDENLVGEPIARDTAAAIAYAASLLHAQDPDTGMGVFTADHLIRPDDVFRKAVQAGLALAESNADALVTFGIVPTHPHTGLGYVELGEAIETGVWRVRSFREKPDAATARRFIEAGNYRWNSGMFAWRTATILARLQQYLPRTHETMRQISANRSAAERNELARQLYPGLARISIDYAVLEKASDIVLVDMNLNWLDLGSWSALSEALGRDAAGNTRAAVNVVDLDCAGCLFVAEDSHLIAALGVTDLVVVHSADATLVCHRDRAADIKRLVEALHLRRPPSSE